MKSDFEFVTLCFDPQNPRPEFEKKVLTSSELNKISHAADKRRTEFSAGRFCAKKAYSTLSGLPLNFNLTEIYADSYGAPFLKDGEYGVSISHDGNIAAALVCEKSKLFAAVDVQRIGVENSKVIYKYVCEPEKAVINENSQSLGYDFCCGAIWAAKEAMSKFFGFGFSVFSLLEISKIEKKNNNEIIIKFKNNNTFGVLIRIYQNYIFTFASDLKNLQKFNEINLKIKPYGFFIF